MSWPDTRSSPDPRTVARGSGRSGPAAGTEGRLEPGVRGPLDPQPEDHSRWQVMLFEERGEGGERLVARDDQFGGMGAQVTQDPVEPGADQRVVGVRAGLGQEQRGGEEVARDAVESRINEQGALITPDI